MGMSDDLDLDLADPAAGGEPPRHVRLGLLGCGNVGAALVALIERDRDEIATRTGVLLDVTRVAVRSLSKERGLALPDGVLTTDGASVATDPDVDVVVEVLGGIEPARGYITAALHAAKPVVTANKELLANVGGELAEVAEGAGVDLLFEAAVAGAIPLIRPLRESLVGERITRVMGIVNGTTNFILTQMAERGTGYAEALAEAQSLGFAERDPTADVEGYDAGAKAAIIATIAFGSQVVAGDVYHEGISNIGAADIAYAEQMGYRIKLLAICETFDDDSVAVRVQPTMVPVGQPLAAVIPVHPFGAMADLPALAAAAPGVPVIEDAACALGAARDGANAGSVGALGCFSFHPRKAITTAEGGMVTTSSAAVADELRRWRAHGMVPGTVPTDFDLPGLNYRLTEMQGALGITQMGKLHRVVEARRAGAAAYDALLAGTELQPPVAVPGSEPVLQSYVAVLPEGTDRAALIAACAAQGVQTQIGTTPIPFTTYYREKYGLRPEHFPVTRDREPRALTLPLFPGITAEQQQKVVDTVLAAL